VQALNPAIFLAYAAADHQIAAGIAAFLDRGADVRVFLEEGQMQPGEDLAAKAREGRMADVVLVLFSRNGMPSRWPRAQWEGPLVTEPAAEGVRIGFVKCDDCVPPRVLAPLFECEGLNLRGLRKLKRWVRDRAATYTPPDSGNTDPGRADSGSADPANAADLEILGIAIADRPGTETLASPALAFEFVQAYREDFDEVFRLEAGGRTLAALSGDLATQLGMRLEGDVQSNLERLRGFCSERRFLMLLEGVQESVSHELIFGGRCSTLMATGAGPQSGSDPLRKIQDALARIDPADGWAGMCSLARQGRRLAREMGRIAECFELMQQWHAAAVIEDDRAVLNESAREMVWILEGWGRTEEAERLEYDRATEFEEQMKLW
jgi:TIR domain